MENLEILKTINTIAIFNKIIIGIFFYTAANLSLNTSHSDEVEILFLYYYPYTIYVI